MVDWYLRMEIAGYVVFGFFFLVTLRFLYLQNKWNRKQKEQDQEIKDSLQLLFNISGVDITESEERRIFTEAKKYG